MIIISNDKNQVMGELCELTYELSRLFSMLDESQFVENNKKYANEDNALFLEWLDKLGSLVEINKQMAKLIEELEEREQNKDEKEI